MAEEKQEKNSFEYGDAATAQVSLSQALLAPLDAIFKAQIHGARSFLNMLLQVGYPHQTLGDDGKPQQDRGKPYNQEFFYEVDVNGHKEVRKVSIPALALVPVAPLAVESAVFKLEMKAEQIDKHSQMQESEKSALANERDYSRNKRPWYLVSDPISIRGTLAAPANRDALGQSTQSSTIQIEVRVAKMAMPAGLDKLLTSLTQSSHASKAGE